MQEFGRRPGRSPAAARQGRCWPPSGPVVSWLASHSTSLAGIGYGSGSAFICTLVNSDPSTATPWGRPDLCGNSGRLPSLPRDSVASRRDGGPAVAITRLLLARTNPGKEVRPVGSMGRERSTLSIQMQALERSDAAMVRQPASFLPGCPGGNPGSTSLGRRGISPPAASWSCSPLKRWAKPWRCVGGLPR